MDIFTKFKSAIKIRPIKIDNEVFQLHYRVTTLMLAASGALVASKQHFGDPIECITKDDVPAKIMNNYCWVHSTFTVADACANLSHALTAHPCVDKSIDTTLAGVAGDVPEKDKVYHAYYQWVYFVLFFQAALFYAPHFFWKMYESRLMAQLTGEMKNPLKSIRGDSKDLKRTIKYLSNYRRFSMHNEYMYHFVIFEAANLVNIFLQIIMVNKFLHGAFNYYGWDLLTRALNDIEETDADPADRIFPKMTKCTFRRFGPSGDLNRYDALCILPLNILNEKIYLIMWFWFVILAIITTIWIIYRLCVLFKPRLRLWNLRRRANYTNTRHLRYVINKTPPGTWFLLSLMCDNMAPNTYSKLIADLHKSLHLDELARAAESQGARRKKASQLFDNDDDEEDQLEDDFSGASSDSVDSTLPELESEKVAGLETDKADAPMLTGSSDDPSRKPKSNNDNKKKPQDAGPSDKLAAPVLVPMKEL